MKNTRRALLKSVGAIGSLAISGDLGAASTSEPEQEGELRTPSRPTAVRCVVTGQTKSGKSGSSVTLVSDGVVEAMIASSSDLIALAKSAQQPPVASRKPRVPGARAMTSPSSLCGGNTDPLC